MTKRRRTITEADKRAARKLRVLWEKYRETNPRVSQEAAAARLGWSQSAWSQFLRGEVSLGTAATLKCARFFGVHPGAIREEMEDVPYLTKTPAEAPGPQAEPKLSADAIELANVWQRLPADRRACFRDMIYLEAVVHSSVPWLSISRPTKESYEQFEKRVQRAWRDIDRKEKA